MKIKSNIAVSDSGFLFNPSSGDSYSVNPIAQQIIRLVQEQLSDAEIVQSIVEQYRIDAGTVERDLYDFKQMLQSYQLTEKSI